MAELAYAPSRLTEATPSALSYDMSKRVSSLITDINQVIVYPRNGSQSITQTTQGQNEIEFAITSTPYLIDPQSVHLVMNLTVNFAGSANSSATDLVIPQDSICPWFYLIRTYINGLQLESLQDADLLAHLISWHVSRDTYKTKGSFANPAMARWADAATAARPDSSGGGIFNPASSNVNYLDNSNYRGWGPIDAGGNSQGGTVSLTRQVVIPLNWLGLFSGSAFIPPQVGGNIQLKFTTNQLSRMFYNGKGLTNADAPNNPITGITFSEIKLVYDSVQVADEMLMAIGQMAAAGPLHMPCIHHRVQSDATNQSAGSVSGPAQYLYSLATSNLVSLFHYYLEQEQLSGGKPLVYNFNPGFGSGTSSYYVEIGGKQFPSVSQSQGVALAYLNYADAVAGAHCLSSDYYNPIQLTNGTLSGAFRLGLSLERLKGAAGDGTSAGYSTKNAAGLVRVFVKPSDTGYLQDGTTAASILSPTDRLITVGRYMEYVLISGAGVSTTNIGS